MDWPVKPFISSTLPLSPIELISTFKSTQESSRRRSKPTMTLRHLLRPTSNHRSATTRGGSGAVSNIPHRHFATKYTARVIDSSSDGRSVAVEVDTPTLHTDVRGYPLPRRDLICKVTKILLNRSTSSTSPSDDPFLHLSDYLETLTITLTPSEASEILKSLNHPHKALQFFRFCPSHIPDFRHNSFTYNRLLLILSKSSSSDRFDLVRRIIDEMERLGVRGSISTVNILIGIFGVEDNGGEGLERCMGLVKKWELKMNSYTYKCLLQAYLRSNDSNKAFDVYTEMRRRGYKLDIFAYNMLLDALAKDEK
ncbi:hypothetical protein L1049_003859 [Liquidambar formosana]|uniref:Pentatricopeptide repeat-containing protein n=1 Tax=Liquidambar formosana TaxID=63359 RepID=A0AAP0RN47_LIQFO